jgi:hypothetical protein
MDFHLLDNVLVSIVADLAEPARQSCRRWPAEPDRAA